MLKYIIILSLTIVIFRQRETENVIKLRAKKETIGSEFEAIVSAFHHQRILNPLRFFFSENQS